MRLLIVDLSSVAYPLWFASADKPVSFMYEGAVSRIRRAAEGFDRVVIACDSGRCFRHDLSPAYKANRAEREPQLIEQLRRVQETLAADGYCVMAAEGFEADDVVATVAVWARREPPPFAEVEAFSSDKDLLVLTAAPGVTVRSVTSGNVFGPVEVCQKFNLKRPEQVRDMLALAGDSSDGVPGVKGIGPVNAAKLLAEYGDLNTIVESLDKIPASKVRDALAAAHADGSLALSRKLVTLRTDVPLDFARIIERREPEPVADGFGDDIPPSERTSGSVGSAGREDTTPARAPEEAGTTQGTTRDVAKRDGTVVQERIADTPPTADTILDRLSPPEEWTKSLEPKDMRQAAWLSRQVCSSRLFSAYGNPEAVLMCLMAGRELGLTAMASLRSIRPVEGRPTLSAQLIIGLVLRSGLAEYIEPVLSECSDQKATWRTKRNGREEQRWTHTIAMAQAAGMVKEKSNWARRPAAMLMKQAGVELARAVYPDVVANLYDPDEIGGEP